MGQPMRHGRVEARFALLCRAFAAIAVIKIKFFVLCRAHRAMTRLSGFTWSVYRWLDAKQEVPHRPLRILVAENLWLVNGVAPTERARPSPP